MGCGTAILAILASKLGAESIDAIDIDEWAFRNALENIEINNATHIKVLQGDKTNIPSKDYDIILANINRNILIDDMEAYFCNTRLNGLLLLSGIYVTDLPLIKETANNKGFKFIKNSERNNWCSALFQKAG
jgi:ribosomal protein L11 methyltransferase